MQIAVLRRVQDVDAARDDGNGAVFDRDGVGCRIDAERQSRGHDISGVAETFGKHARQLLAGSGCHARTDDPHRGPVEQADVALDAQNRRAAIGCAQGFRIAGLGDEEHARTDAGCRFQFLFRDLERTNTDRPITAATLGKFRQRVQRALGAAVTVEQAAEGDGTDVLGSDQPKAGEAVGIGQRHFGQRRRLAAGRHRQPFAPILLSVPDIKRRMLA